MFDTTKPSFKSWQEQLWEVKVFGIGLVYIC